jgi:DNA-binding MarR family transcriptional regulator
MAPVHGRWRTCLTGSVTLIRRPVHPRIQRRRALAASLNIPAGLEEKFAKFTEGELAVLKTISGKVVRDGACTLTMNAIADLSSITRRVVMTAIRTAEAEGLIEVRHGRRYSTITVSPTWRAWLDRNGDAPPDGPRG